MDEEESEVWKNVIDKKFEVKVFRKDDHLGELCITKLSDPKTILFRKDVTLSFRAIFGPDGNDVNDWIDITINFVDNINADRE